jgi:hypothetical protein
MAYLRGSKDRAEFQAYPGEVSFVSVPVGEAAEYER